MASTNVVRWRLIYAVPRTRELAHGRLSCRPTTKGSPASALRLGEGIPSTLLLGRAIERLAKRNFTRRETFSPISPKMIIVGSSSNETPDANRPCCRRVAYAADVTRGRAAFGADSLFNDITHGHGRHPDQTWWSRPPLRMDPQPRTPPRIYSGPTSRLALGAQDYFPAAGWRSGSSCRPSFELRSSDPIPGISGSAANHRPLEHPSLCGAAIFSSARQRKIANRPHCAVLRREPRYNRAAAGAILRPFDGASVATA